MLNTTNCEKEVAAYMRGDVRQAALYAGLDDADTSDETWATVRDLIENARNYYPAEDCLADLLSDLRRLALGRVTKADVEKFILQVEESQGSLARDTEFGMDELRRALGHCTEGAA